MEATCPTKVKQLWRQRECQKLGLGCMSIWWTLLTLPRNTVPVEVLSVNKVWDTKKQLHEKCLLINREWAMMTLTGLGSSPQD